MARVDAARTRRSFSRLENITEVPNSQTSSAVRSTGSSTPRRVAFETILTTVSPIETCRQPGGRLRGDPSTSPSPDLEVREGPHRAPLTVKVAFQNRETGEIREQSVFMGDFWMTDWGTFIINGTERASSAQLVAPQAPT